jgi:hypothetical protein
MAWLRGMNGKQHPELSGQTAVLDAPAEAGRCRQSP